MKSSVADPGAMSITVLVLAGLLLFIEPNGVLAAEEAGRDGSASQGKCELTEPKREMLSRINEARSQARQCGNQDFEAAEPLTWNCTLEAAAKAHSRDMAENGYFSHTGPDGVGIQQRVSSQGYEWRAVGENIAAGQEAIDAVVEGWLESPGHCRNIMNEAFTEMGMAKVEADGSDSMYSPYWTQVLAQPR